MKHLKIPLLFLLLISISCSSSDKSNNVKTQDNLFPKTVNQNITLASNSDEEFKKAWMNFVNAVLTGNLKEIKGLSSHCIYCTDCVTNTPKESSVFDTFRNTNQKTWSNKLYNEFSYLPIDEFLREDLPIIFDSTTKSRMIDISKFRFQYDNRNQDLYQKSCIIKGSSSLKGTIIEMFVTINDPSSENEGLEKAFAFIKTEEGYKFCGYSTIP